MSVKATAQGRRKGSSEMRFSCLRDLGVAGRLSGRYPRAFVGQPLDDRGRHSAAVARASSDHCHVLAYDYEKFALTVDGVSHRSDDGSRFTQAYGAEDILIDATTLDVPELLLLTRAFQAARSISFLYVEPDNYQKRPSEASEQHEFSLSAGFRPFSPIPGFTPELSAQRQGRLLAFVGFEPSRLSRILSPDEVGHIKSWSVAFGVPPFQAKWEMSSFAQNADALDEAAQQSAQQAENSQDVFFVGANDPLAAFNLIGTVARSIEGNSERLILAPLGTKPASVSVALFAAARKDVRVMFDFPKRLQDRTSGVGRAHQYSVMLR